MSGNKNQRSKKGKGGSKFLKIDNYILNTKAFLSLTSNEVRIWLLLAARYNGGNNGRISLSVREAASLGRMSRTTAQKAFQTLIDKGFIKRRYIGSFSQKCSYASEYELTHVGFSNQLASKEFASWGAEKNAVPNQGMNGIKLEPFDRRMVV